MGSIPTSPTKIELIMKIAFFSDCYLDLTGGIVSSINALKAELERLGHTVYVFSTGFPRNEKELVKLAEQNIFVVPSCRLFFRGLTPVSRRPAVIEKWLEQNFPELKDFDIFHIHYEGGCSIAGIRLGRKLGVPVVQTMHGREDMGEGNLIPYGLRTFVAIMLNLFHSWYLPHRRKVAQDEKSATNTARAKMWELMVNHANYADVVVTPSQHFKDKLLNYGVTQPIKVVPNGVKDELVESDVAARELKSGEKLRIVWHSRVSAEKRMMPFLEALTMVDAKRYHMDVYGGGGDYFRAKRFAKRHKLAVKFYNTTPFRPKVLRTMLAAQLDVLVSYDFDTFGMTLIEAEAVGLPVLFCDPEMCEVVPEGSFVMSDDATPASMAQALNDLLDHPERVAEMSQVMLKKRDEVRQSRRVLPLIKIYEELRSTK